MAAVYVTNESQGVMTAEQLSQAVELRDEIMGLFRGGASAVGSAFADECLTAASVLALLDLRARLLSLMAGIGEAV